MTVIENNIYFSNLLIIIEDHPVVLSHTLLPPFLILFTSSHPFPPSPHSSPFHFIQHFLPNFYLHFHFDVSVPPLCALSCTTLFSYFYHYLISSPIIFFLVLFFSLHATILNLLLNDVHSIAGSSVS